MKVRLRQQITVSGSWVEWGNVAANNKYKAIKKKRSQVHVPPDVECVGFAGKSKKMGIKIIK